MYFSFGEISKIILFKIFMMIKILFILIPQKGNYILAQGHALGM
jgi:hypothetical protein